MQIVLLSSAFFFSWHELCEDELKWHWREGVEVNKKSVVRMKFLKLREPSNVRKTANKSSKSSADTGIQIRGHSRSNIL